MSIMLILTFGCTGSNQGGQNVPGNQNNAQPSGLIGSHEIKLGESMARSFSEADIGESVFLTGMFFTKTPQSIQITRTKTGESFLGSGIKEEYGTGQEFRIKKGNSAEFYTAKITEIKKSDETVTIELYG